MTAESVGRRLNVTLLPPGASSYFLVSAHVDDVESPTGENGSAQEIDRSQSICR